MYVYAKCRFYNNFNILKKNIHKKWGHMMTVEIVFKRVAVVSLSTLFTTFFFEHLFKLYYFGYPRLCKAKHMKVQRLLIECLFMFYSELFEIEIRR